MQGVEQEATLQDPIMVADTIREVMAVLISEVLVVLIEVDTILTQELVIDMADTNGDNSYISI